MKCPKCGKIIDENLRKCPYCKAIIPKTSLSAQMAFIPNILTSEHAFKLLSDNIASKDKKLFAITGENGIGKTYLANRLKNSLNNKNYHWIWAKCSNLTQITTGGVVHEMMMNLFNLPDFCTKIEDIYPQALKYFSKELNFLNEKEIQLFINFLYPEKMGEFEDILIKKHQTCDVLNKIFDALVKSGKFIFVIDNMDDIDGFSIEFITNFIKRSNNWKSLKLIALYTEHKPISTYFPTNAENIENSTLNIHLGAESNKQIENSILTTSDTGAYITKREKDIILEKSDGNFLFAKQASSYCFDCQIADLAFILTNNFSKLISDRLSTLKKINPQAYKVLLHAAVFSEKFNTLLIKEIISDNSLNFAQVLNYLVKTEYIHKVNDVFYEFNSTNLWKTIFNIIKNDSYFEEVNIKIGKFLTEYSINTNPIMAMIAHNIKENRMAFDIWTKTSRLSSFIGDINLYTVSQRQCLALLNEFNENDTLNIRYNIYERLGKLLTEFNPKEAMEYLPDAISNAKKQNDEVKEIELLSFMSECCKKTNNPLGDIECCDNILKKLSTNQELEAALIKSSKIASVFSIGNYGQCVNIIDNDILPVLNKTLSYPKLNKIIPLGLIFETKIYSTLYLSKSLSMQGNDRCFEVLDNLFELINKNNKDDINLLIKAKLILANANIMKGNYETASELLSELSAIKNIEPEKQNEIEDNCFNELNFSTALKSILSRQYEGLKQELSQSAMFADNTDNEFYKNIYRTFLGKILCDSLQAQKALEIYNEQITYFAQNKYAFGAILTWYYIAEATLIIEKPKKALEIATKALEISQDPKINNFYLSVLLMLLISNIHLELADFISAKMYLDKALEISKQYNMQDLIAHSYFNFGKYFYELGKSEIENQAELLKGSNVMFDKALNITEFHTKNLYLKDKILTAKDLLTKLQ